MPDDDNPGKGVGFAAKGPVKITITVSGGGMTRARAGRKGATRKKGVRKRAKKR